MTGSAPSWRRTWRGALAAYVAIGLLQTAYIHARNHEPGGRVTWSWLASSDVGPQEKLAGLTHFAASALVWPLAAPLVIAKWGKPWNNYDPARGGGWAAGDST